MLGKTAARHPLDEFVPFLTDWAVNQPRGNEIYVIAHTFYARKTGNLVEEFLTVHPKTHVHFTSTYWSRLNHVGLWFAKIDRAVVARGVLTSITGPKRKLMRYIHYYSQAPKTVKWKYLDPSHRIAPATSAVTVH